MRISCGVDYQFPLEAEDSGLRFRSAQETTERVPSAATNIFNNFFILHQNLRSRPNVQVLAI